MAKPKKKLTAAQRAAKKQRKKDFMTVLIARRFVQAIVTTLESHSLPLGKSRFSGLESCLLRRLIFKAGALPRLQHPMAIAPHP